MFKALVSSPRRVAKLLRDHLPPEIACLLADELPRQVDGTFITGAGHQRQCDCLFEVLLKDGSTANVLIEHKSYLERKIVLQLTEYQTGIWKRFLNKNPQKSNALPPIITLVICHGVDKWPVPQSFAEMFQGAGEDVEKGTEKVEPVKTLGDLKQPGRYILLNLAEIPRERLSGDGMTRLGLTALHHVTKKPRRKKTLDLILEAWPEEVDEEDLDLEDLLKLYIMEHIELTPETLNQASQDKQERRGGKIVASLAQQLEDRGRSAGHSAGLAKGRSEGLAEGRSKGLAEGKADTVMKQLRLRFGELSEAVKARVARASLEELEVWTERVLTAESLDAVFADDS